MIYTHVYDQLVTACRFRVDLDFGAVDWKRAVDNMAEAGSHCHVLYGSCQSDDCVRALSTGVTLNKQKKRNMAEAGKTKINTSHNNDTAT